MSADFVLRSLGLDFPDLHRTTRHYLGWYSWSLQICLPVLAGYIALSKRDYEGFKRLVLATLVNQIFLELLKTYVVELRPNGSPRSFPSGDTAAAFLGPAFLLFQYRFQTMPGPILGTTVLAMTVAISRVFIKAHWVHDVVAGAILGSSVVYLSLNIMR